jgi:hypothetical protein
LAYLQIDTNTAATFFTQIVQLEGVEYLFQFLWSDREACWYLNLSDQDENLLCAGIRIVIGWPLLRRCQWDLRTPPGLLMCVDMTGQNVEIATATDLGTRVLMFYTTSDDPSLAASLSIPSGFTMLSGTSVQLSAMGASRGLSRGPIDLTSLATWSSSSPKAATVGPGGFLTAVAVGGAVVSATVDAGGGRTLTATGQVTVS